MKLRVQNCEEIELIFLFLIPKKRRVNLKIKEYKVKELLDSA
jgi:hypothetical protein